MSYRGALENSILSGASCSSWTEEGGISRDSSWSLISDPGEHVACAASYRIFNKGSQPDSESSHFS